MSKKRKPAYGGLLVLGLALISLGISVNYAFLGAGVVFMLIGVIGMRKAKAEEAGDRKATDEPKEDDS